VRIAFFGTPAFAVPSLRALVDAGHTLVAVITQPDRRRGRGQRVSASPVRAAADALGLPILVPERARDPLFVRALADRAPELGVVAAYGKILPDAILETPPRGTINVHASLLPKYRGAAPIHRAVIAGERETGITMIRLVAEMDAGPMLGRVVRPIGANETAEELTEALAVIGATLLLETVGRLERREVVEEPQDHGAATFAPRLTREDGRIDWARPAREIHNLVRGLHPWPHAFTFLGERRLAVLRSSVVDPSPPGPAAPGDVLTARRDRLEVRCGGDTALAVHELQPEGRKRLETAAFLAGHPLALPAAFHSSPTGA